MESCCHGVFSSKTYVAVSHIMKYRPGRAKRVQSVNNDTNRVPPTKPNFGAKYYGHTHTWLFWLRMKGRASDEMRPEKWHGGQ